MSIKPLPRFHACAITDSDVAQSSANRGFARLHTMESDGRHSISGAAGW